jgi:hypothetical protein
MGKCSEKQRKLSRYGCYAKLAAKWTAGKLKTGVERIGSFSGEQGYKHKQAFGLFFLALIGSAFIIGAAFFLTAPISNPTAAQVTYTRTYTLSNGSVVVDNGQISGNLKCVVKPTSNAITEANTWILTSLGSFRKSMVNPYWITSILLRVYSGSSASGNWVISTPFTVNSATYNSTMQSWATNYWNLIAANPVNPNVWVLGATPIDNSTWTVTVDSRLLANGVYTFQVLVIWGMDAVPYTVTSMVSGIPTTPPSLSSTSGQASFLSFFGLGAEVPVEVQLPVLFIVIVVVAVVVVVVLRRR